MKKIFKNQKIKYLLFFILGGIVIGSIGITATTYVLESSEIQYSNDKSVQQAIDDLYLKAENCGKGSSETLPIGTLDIAGQTIYIPYTGTYQSVYCVYGTNENYGSVGTISNNKCNLTGLSVNTKYYYKIIGYDSAGKLYETKGEATTIERKPTRVLTGLPTGVKAIVYLDPTDLTRYCDKDNSISTTGTKSGCMKWYAYKEDSSSYTMILDHNTTAKVSSWSEASTQLTTDTTGWSGSPRLITGQEVANITGNTSWTSTGSWFYLDSNSTNQTATSIGASKYYWLFDYTIECTSYGCKVADSLTVGYWTSTSNGSSIAWYVDRNGTLYNRDVSRTSFGVRPVITISKSNF